MLVAPAHMSSTLSPYAHSSHVLRRRTAPVAAGINSTVPIRSGPLKVQAVSVLSCLLRDDISPGGRVPPDPLDRSEYSAAATRRAAEVAELGRGRMGYLFAGLYAGADRIDEAGDEATA
jgi:hypothetical protein